MTSTLANLSLAARIHTGKNSFLSTGLQAGYMQKRMDATSLLFPSQFNGSTYDPSVSNNENFVATRFAYTDFSGGILWAYTGEHKSFSTYKQVQAKVGFAAYHITRPSLSYIPESKEHLYMKIVAHGDLNFTVGSRIGINPSYLFQQQGPYNELTTGVMLRYYLHNETKYTGYVRRTAFGFGGYYRNSDAVIMNLLLEWEERFALGMSYDVNISPLIRSSGSRGGFELTLKYTAPRFFREGSAKKEPQS
jgi:type IX secretion system PorP/SprF family membrane protein